VLSAVTEAADTPGIELIRAECGPAADRLVEAEPGLCLLLLRVTDPYALRLGRTIVIQIDG